MKLNLRTHEVVLIRKILYDRVEDLNAQGENPKYIQKILLLGKRIMRQEEAERRKNERKRLRNRT